MRRSPPDLLAGRPGQPPGMGTPRVRSGGLDLRRAIVALGAALPPGLRRALVGDPQRASRPGRALHWLLGLLPGSRLVVLHCSGALTGYRMKVDWRDHRAFAYGTWEPAFVHAIEAAVRPEMVAVDIGAHVGFYTLLLAKLVGPLGRVLAFEPHPGNFEVLAENVELNDCRNVHLLNKCVAAQPGLFELTIGTDWHGLPGQSGIAKEGAGERTVVEGVALDDLFSDPARPLGFMKVDVEGAETAVLRGAARTIRRDRPVIVVELHDAGSYGEAHPSLALLCEFGYEVTWLERWGYTAHILANPPPREEPR